MATYINTLVNTAGGDLARPTKFRAMFGVPDSLNGYVQDKDLDLLCKNFSIPQRKMEIVDYKYKGKTVPIMGPVDVVHTISITFILDDGHKIRSLFESWLIALDAQYNDKDNDQVKAYKTAVEKRQERTSRLVIAPLNWQEDIEVKYYAFSGLFPTSIGELQYSTDTVSSTQELTVEFSYLDYSDYIGGSDILNEVSGVLNNGLQAGKETLSTGAQTLLGGLTGATNGNTSAYNKDGQVPNIDVNSKEFQG